MASWSNIYKFKKMRVVSLWNALSGLHIAARAGGSESVLAGGPWATVPELMFEKKGLIPAVQQLLVAESIC